jgi:hypothetical protein
VPVDATVVVVVVEDVDGDAVVDEAFVDVEVVGDDVVDDAGTVVVT